MTRLQWFETKWRYTIGSYVLRLGVKICPMPVHVIVPDCEPTTRNEEEWLTDMFDRTDARIKAFEEDHDGIPDWYDPKA